VADPAVFLDRDGTLIEEIGFASRPEQIRILGGVAQALRELADAGYRLIVVTNQSGIARGFLTEEDLERFHDALDRQLHLLGAAVDAYYACPHHPDPGGMARPDLAVECECRKPKPGLILRAAEDFGVDLKASWTVGDTWRDVAAGAAAGTRTLKLPADEAHQAPRPAHVAPPTAEARSLAEATRIILGRQAPTLEETAAVAAREDEEQDDGLGPVEEPAESVEAEGDAPEDREGIATEDEPLQPPDALRQGEVKDYDEIAERVETEDRAPGASLPDTATAGGEAAEPLVTGVESEAEPPSALAAETPASSADGQCARCGRDIESDEIAAGAAGRRDGFLLCPECLAQQPREPGAGPDASTEDLLRLVLAELQRLRRAQRPSSLSSFRLLAYVVQAAALFFGFGMAVLGDERDLYLQIALLLQLLVLALLLFERRS
jgi:D-glycero-D-manno-heptose 1,7-bisphosphate phosphatase